jgi:formylmethanofuran dehydrogenase subunit E
MESLDTFLREAEIAHGHRCAGQVPGARMAMPGCRMLGIDDPKDRSIGICRSIFSLRLVAL